MSFEVDIGYASRRGARESNQDFAAALRAAPSEPGRGLIAAIADGVSAGGQGSVAAQTTVRCLLDDFFAAPATWETTVALDRVIAAQNAWLAGHNRRHAAAEGAAAMTTLTALVLQGHGYTLAHVGDTRAWRLHEGECRQLTQDHALDHPDLRSRLTRAVGLDDRVRVDYLQGELQVGDVFLLTSDGVHGVLRRRTLAQLAGEGTAQQASEAIVQAALDAGSRDNATALVIRVLGLDSGGLDDELRRGRHLPVPPKLKVGEALDGFTITALVADTGVHRLYQARDAQGTLLALKTLHESRANDPQERAMLAHEAWLGAHVTAHDARGFVRLREVAEPSALYLLFDWHGGRTLEQWLAQGRRFTVDEVVAGALDVARALGRLHRHGVIHRDIKPANLHLGDDGQWRILDLGVALSGREPEAQRELHAGTPSYMNPEQWEPGGRADRGSDLFALGATLYRWLTGHLPYGEIEPYQSGRYRRDPVPPSRRRPDVPIWLDHVVLKAVTRDARQRFETAEELALALERGASRLLSAPLPTPLLKRDPGAVWKLAFAISALFNVLLIVWLLFLPR
ncbi:bifunctional protein-serine/threonine kinase/phosphatase [Ideonella sp. BN130291]|uniref:bifunctional protein-serine/threonine kinase/phosphatase n=1 Tax=Ideonella sp. BN130291 TaxID=3112940 RepID=UPI002E263F89|nr:bifunctional protein-serine/threonine kinase/phosphatase [Ideonella sp. BN130291]